MEYGREITQWIQDNKGFEYYLTSRFTGLFRDCNLVCTGENEAEIIYKNYAILHMAIQERSIYLLPFRLENRKSDRPVIQDKLCHEYNDYFKLSPDCFKITQYNMYALIQYVDQVKKKISAGFERYSQLLRENIGPGSSGYLKIGVNNAFSLEELRELINAYNQLYSLFYYACENGVEEISQKNISQVLCEHNMVLESIHIGSEGFLTAVGVELIVSVIQEFVKAVFDADRAKAEERRQELRRKAEMEEYMATKQYIFQLIDLLDRYLEKREQGCRNGVRLYIEHEIDDIVQKIEQLQGTSHIDIAV